MVITQKRNFCVMGPYLAVKVAMCTLQNFSSHLEQSCITILGLTALSLIGNTNVWQHIAMAPLPEFLFPMLQTHLTNYLHITLAKTLAIPLLLVCV